MLNSGEGFSPKNEFSLVERRTGSFTTFISTRSPPWPSVIQFTWFLHAHPQVWSVKKNEFPSVERRTGSFTIFTSTRSTFPTLCNPNVPVPAHPQGLPAKKKDFSVEMDQKQQTTSLTPRLTLTLTITILSRILRIQFLIEYFLHT